MAGEAVEVGQFVALARKSLVNEPYLANAAIIGELTKLTLARSGHSYFTLTDSNGSIDCVLFNGNNSFNSQSIKVGNKLVALGGIDVYVKTGRMQFKASRVQPVKSIGELEKTRQELIQRWQQDGTMDRPRLVAPLIPKKLHIITGAGSAALSDMERLISDRWPNFSYTLIPVLVQGNSAPAQIIQAIEIASKSADLIIVGRGGGSPEDLWSFNLESVCQAIIDCPIPVVSAVGHESDYMVSDMIADIRASTPSNAIERVVPIKDDLLALIAQATDRLDFAIDRLFIRNNEKIGNLIIRLSAAPMRGISNARLKQSQLSGRINSATDRILMREKNLLTEFSSILKSTNPTNVLERGYSMTVNEKGNPVTSIVGLKAGDSLTIVLKDGQVQTEVKE
ncbi:MAG: exodeoxyribonuclease VII large subunit [Euryarchaeota archaeon]|jgi:exodeoxyribonuclease VII large subunit|nr:exodeoxyribonuclease VII large subunit [Euryarchaeota archaeon]NCF97382.1 exodeoxyribonuclease VII large subunit [Euryarchaeota archaeon]